MTAPITHRIGLNRNLTAAEVDANFDSLNGAIDQNAAAIATIGASSVQSVNAKTGAVVLAKADFGLGNVDNTSDANKPVSTQQASAITVVDNKVTSLAVTVGMKLDASKLGQPLGAATLDSTGLLVASQLPNIDLVSFLGNSASQSAMLALTGNSGDYTVRTDLSPNTVYIITGSPQTTLANWTPLAYPSGGTAVTSVAGRTGVVVLAKGDVGLGNVDNTSDATYSASTATLTNKTISGSSNTLTNLPAANVTGTLAVVNGGNGTATPSITVTGTGGTLTGSWGSYTLNLTGGGGGGSGDMILASAQTIPTGGTKTFSAGTFRMGGATSGAVTFAVPAVAGAGTVTFPTSGTLATLNGSTFTGATLTAPNITSPTGIVPTDVGLGNVVNVLQAPAGTPRTVTSSRAFVSSDEGCPIYSTATTPVTMTLAQNIGVAPGQSFCAVLAPLNTGSMSVAAGTGTSLDTSGTGATVSGVGNMLAVVATGLNAYKTFAAGSGSSPQYAYVGSWASRTTTGLTAGDRAFMTDWAAIFLWTGAYWKPIGELTLGAQLTDLSVTETGAGVGVTEVYAGFNCLIPVGLVQPGGEIAGYARLLGTASTTSKVIRLKIGTVSNDNAGVAMVAAGHTNATTLEMGVEGRAQFRAVAEMLTDSTNGTSYDSNGLANLTTTTSINFSSTAAYVKATLSIATGSAAAVTATLKWAKVTYRPGS